MIEHRAMLLRKLHNGLGAIASLRVSVEIPSCRDLHNAYLRATITTTQVVLIPARG